MKISSFEIRDKFLDFFIQNKHLEIKGASVIPKNDPTLLYINAGMAAIKNYFTGDEIPEKRELCNIQPCIRTIDIDDIGDKHHLTSFYMLGSWSIGSYFKEKAIELAFDFLVNNLKIPIKKLYVSVFSGDKKINLPFDSESKNAWLKVGIPENHIVALGLEDNFWGPASQTGPCGPCTEVFYDTESGQEYIPGKFFDTKRYIEIWNAGVFMMLNKNSEDSFSSLPFNSVDTGAGLERLNMTLNNLDSVYETDLLLPIKNFISSCFEFEKENERKIRILTDHMRTVCLILSEKQKISNEGRGYIPRKLIRKCIVIAHKNIKNNNYDLLRVIKFIINNFKNINKKFEENKEYIISEFSQEQDKFKNIVKIGFEKLNSIEFEKNKKISGELAFDLVTTFGLPFEIIEDFAKENSIVIDKKEFNNLIEKHKNISRSNFNNKNLNNNFIDNKIFEKTDDLPKTNFVGYDKFEIQTNILKMLSPDGTELNSSENQKKIILILQDTPVYAKSGGQESDTGIIFNKNFSAEIKFAIKNNNIFMHYCEINSGIIKSGEKINIKINLDRRQNNSNAHSATHLLQSALKNIFGYEVHQQGSKVEENSLHFDFNYSEKITREHICKIEKIVNKYISKNFKSEITEMNLKDAVAQGATAIFSEKYSDLVRVVSFDKISKELCGGTHVSFTGQIGMFIIISCESIGKGVKRITAFTGEKALEYIQKFMNYSLKSCEILHTKIENLPQEIENKLNSRTKLEVTKKLQKSNLNFLKTKIPVAYFVFDSEFSSGLVKNIANEISGIFLAINHDGRRVSLAVYKKLNLNAKEILNNILSNLGGKGGGSAEIASGGVKNKNSDEIITAFKSKFES